MKTSKYEILLTVLEEKNITKAAEKLDYTQPGVSQIVKNIENDLELKLIVPSGRGIEITESGKKLYGTLEQIVKWEKRFEAVANSLIGLEEGKIRVGVIASVAMQWMPYIIKEFTEIYPNIEFELVFVDFEEIVEQLRQGKMDCGILIEEESEDLDFIPLMVDEFKVVLPEGHRLAVYDEIPIKELEKEVFIIPTTAADVGIYKILKDANIKPEMKYFSDEDYSSLAMVQLGLGVTILPQLILDGAVADVDIRPFKEHYSRKLGIAVHNLEYATPINRAFLEFMSDWIEENYRPHRIIKTD